MNPELDVGQAQGGFVFGLGYWLSEHFIRDPKTGQLLTRNTWVSVLIKQYLYDTSTVS
jgi:xanthine dehydrogenase/oxidase